MTKADYERGARLLREAALRCPTGSNFNLIEVARDLGMQPFANSRHTDIVIAAWRAADKAWSGGAKIAWDVALNIAARHFAGKAKP